MNTANSTTTTENTSRIQQVFTKQRAVSRRNPYPSLEARLQTLNKLQKILLENQAAIAEAVNADFGCRSPQETRLLEIFGLLGGIDHSRKRLKKWMKQQRRHVSLAYIGAKNTVPSAGT